MPDRKMHVAKPAHVPVAAEPVRIDDAVAFNAPKQNTRNSFVAHVALSQKNALREPRSTRMKKGFFRAVPRLPTPGLLLALTADKHIGSSTSTPQLYRGEIRLQSLAEEPGYAADSLPVSTGLPGYRPLAYP